MNFLTWMFAFLMLATSVGLLITRDWRWDLGILAIQYAGVFWMVHLTWPIGMAAVKIITGWMVCTVLGIAEAGQAPARWSKIETVWPRGMAFRLLTAGLVILVASVFASSLINWLGIINFPSAWGSVLLIGMGLIHLGTTDQPLRMIIGLLTLMAGFEILYAAVETSILVAALLAVVNCGMALVGAYLLNTPVTESSQ